MHSSLKRKKKGVFGTLVRAPATLLKRHKYSMPISRGSISIELCSLRVKTLCVVLMLSVVCAIKRGPVHSAALRRAQTMAEQRRGKTVPDVAFIWYRGVQGP